MEKRPTATRSTVVDTAVAQKISEHRNMQDLAEAAIFAKVRDVVPYDANTLAIFETLQLYGYTLQRQEERVQGIVDRQREGGPAALAEAERQAAEAEAAYRREIVDIKAEQSRLENRNRELTLKRNTTTGRVDRLKKNQELQREAVRPDKRRAYVAKIAAIHAEFPELATLAHELKTLQKVVTFPANSPDMQGHLMGAKWSDPTVPVFNANSPTNGTEIERYKDRLRARIAELEAPVAAMQAAWDAREQEAGSQLDEYWKD